MTTLNCSVAGSQITSTRMKSEAGVFSSARVIAALTMISRVLGVVREGVLSYFFSTGGLLSAFRIAFMVPNLARRLFGEGALSSSMIPVLTESLQTRGERPSREFVGRLLVVMAVFLGLGVLAIEAGVLAWRSIKDDPALWLVAIMMPYMVPICLTAVVGGVLNVRKSFAIPAGVPILLNITIVIAAVTGAWGLGLTDAPLMRIIAWGVVVGGVVQLVVSYVGLRALGFGPIYSTRGDSSSRPLPSGRGAEIDETGTFSTSRDPHPDPLPNREREAAAVTGTTFGLLRQSWNDPYVRKVCTLLLPMTIGLSAMQINSLADYLIAYLFIKSDGERVGPAVLGYAQYLYQLPLGVFGISLATAIFPTLSERAASGDHKGMAEILARGIRVTQVTALPAAIGLMFIARPLTAVLFERGAFNADDTARVAATLVFYCIGLVFYFTQHLLVRAFYSLHDSKTPARVAGYMVAIDFVMNLSLVFPMQERGLAMSTSVCAGIQVIWLAILLTRRLPDLDWGNVMTGVARIGLATGAMAVALWGVNAFVLANGRFGSSPYMQLPVLLGVGLVMFVAVAKLLKAPELGWAMERRKAVVPVE